MPPPKKAAKKVAKKAAKKTAGHHHDKHHHSKDLRRAFEHMGRLEVLRKGLRSSTADAVGKLTQLAQKEVEREHNKDAADLLRASEHLSFAVLAGSSPASGGISAELTQSIAEHFQELMGRAEEHWADQERHSTTLAAIYESSCKSAVNAFKDGAYYQALEFARAAEALAHIKQDGQHGLERGKKDLQLEGS